MDVEACQEQDPSRPTLFEILDAWIKAGFTEGQSGFVFSGSPIYDFGFRI
jgi:hypothetical protein